MSREEFFKGSSSSTPDRYVIEVWRCNARVVKVYRTCQLSYVGMSGVCIGLSAEEIRTALELHRVPRRLWPEMTVDLTVMAQAAAQYLAEEARKAADERAARKR